jgi:hypothetical protein
MLKRFFTMAACAVLAQSIFAQPAAEGGGGLLSVTNGDALAVRVPKGWVLDNRIGKSQGIDMVFYPAGAVFQGMTQKSDVFAYVTPTVKIDKGTTVTNLIKKSVGEMMVADAKTKLDLEMKAKKDPQGVSIVTVAKFSMPTRPRFERVAYLEDERTIYTVVLSAISEEELAKRTGFLKDFIDNHKRLVATAKK